MKKILKIIISSICILLLNVTEIFGQQEYMITQYMYNGLALNPAYAGIHDGISLSALWREQWVGINGAPSTQLLSIHAPLKHKEASWGALLYRDVLGVKTEYTGYFSYAYRIKVGEASRLSLGLQASLHNFNNNISRLDNQQGLVQNIDPNDVLYQSFSGENLGFKWNFGTGLMLHSDRYYLGASIPQLLNRDFYDQSGVVQNSRLIRHIYVSGGYVFNTQSNFVLKPNFLVKMVKNAPVEVDINLNALVSKIIWIGVSTRSEFGRGFENEMSIFESVSGLVAFQITPQLQVGYSYDFTITAINTNTHEIMLNYIFNLPTVKIVTPRYF